MNLLEYFPHFFGIEKLRLETPNFRNLLILAVDCANFKGVVAGVIKLIEAVSTLWTSLFLYTHVLKSSPCNISPCHLEGDGKETIQKRQSGGGGLALQKGTQLARTREQARGESDSTHRWKAGLNGAPCSIQCGIPCHNHSDVFKDKAKPSKIIFHSMNTQQKSGQFGGFYCALPSFQRNESGREDCYSMFHFFK